MKIHKYIFIPLLLLVFAQANAQPVLNFTRIVNNWPTIELYFKTACDGRAVYVDSTSNIRILDGGREIKDFTLWCPDLLDAAFTAAIIVNISELESDSNRTLIVNALHRFIREMDGVHDSVAVIIAADPPIVQQSITHDTSAISAAFNEIFNPVRESALCDAIIVGIDILAAIKRETCRKVIVISDRADDVSVHDYWDATQYSSLNRMPVTTVSYDEYIEEDSLKDLTIRTGGRYYAVTSVDSIKYPLLSIADELNWCLNGPFYLDCLIMYQASCPKGGIRAVDINLVDYCSDTTITARRVYRPPFDTTVIDWLVLSIPNVNIAAANQEKIPVRFKVGKAVTVPPCTISIKRESKYFISFALDKIGTALENDSVTLNETSSSYDFIIHTPFTLSDSGTLFNIMADVKDVDSTLDILIHFLEWRDDSSGCLAVSTSDGHVKISPTSIGTHVPALARAFSIAPNPSSGAFEVALEFDAPTAFSMRIVNTLGQTVYQKAVSERRTSYSGSIALDSPPGVYFFLLESGGEYDYKTIVVRYQ